MSSELNLFIFDFDETLSVRSSSDPIEELAHDKQKLNLDDINYRYEKLHHCWNIRMNEVHERLAQQGIQTEQLIKAFRTIELSPGVDELFHNIYIRNGRIVIMSNACDLAIKECLQAQNLFQYVYKIESNPVRQIDPIILIDEYEKPLQTTCEICEPNLCKGSIIDKYREKDKFDKIIFIGDGNNDVCAALRLNKNDIVFAKHDEKDNTKIYPMYNILKKQYFHELKSELFIWNTMKDMTLIINQRLISSSLSSSIIYRQFWNSLNIVWNNETLPINAIPLFATCNPGYQTTLASAVASANKVYQEFILSKEGKYFSGQVVIIGDANGAILAYDALCLNHTLEDTTSLYGEEGSTPRTPALSKRTIKDGNDTCSGQSSNRLNTKTTLTNDNFETNDNLSYSSDNLRARQENSSATLTFDVNEFFSFGSPLSLILAYRQMVTDSVVRPYCGQLYNLFHACDPNASRIEPLIQSEFSQIPPCCIPRYSQFPLGDGESTLLIEYIHQCSNLFLNNNNTNQLPNEINTLLSDIRQTWWGSRRVDYIVYCPEFLMSQPAHVLPIVFHSSYWESRDVMSFILRNITRNQEQFHLFNSHTNTNPCSFAPMKPTERWLHRTTGVKIRNLAPNHRGNDTMVVDARPQTIHAKFHYGPIDMVCLVNEKVDIYVMRSAPYGEWTLLNTVETDTHGRIRYTISDDKKLPLGLHPVKLVVRGDHTTVDLFLTVLPPKSEAVIFSIDGSFTSSFSVSHHDPKVRPGAVDVVRYWQELGYIIIYITARPDIQQRQVVHWLAQHNFPHGMTLFNDGIYREPIKHKAEMLRNVVENADLVITAAYGSTKDVSGYQLIHVPPEKLFVVGKIKNRLQGQARFLTDGYALHLSKYKIIFDN
ncbi:unnamed protein product [Rotaria sp. Silwood2]|nr:unnamed protein product [Rotaria sp. Silwood2]